MFKRENRLVPGVRFNKSRVFTTSQFVFKEKTNGLELNRFGIVVSKKIDKRAVVRNGIKRFFREVLGDFNKNMLTGHDILVIIRIGILGKTKEENKIALGDTLKKAGLIQK